MQRSGAGTSDDGRGALRRHERMAWFLAIGAIELYVVVELILEASRPGASRFFLGMLFGAATILLVAMATSRGLLTEATALVRGREAERLEGGLLVGRTIQHHLANQLALTVGYAALLARHPKLDAELRPLADEALRGASQAAETVRALQRLARLEPAAPPLGLGERPILDLDRSVED
jgi:hypothetical protein